MKLIARLTALTLIAFLATAAFAAGGANPSTTKINLNLDTATTIAGTKLAAGQYTVYVNRNGDDANVRITNGKREVVNTAAKFKSMSEFAGITALTVDSNRDVVELQSTKLKGAVVFEPAPGHVATTESSMK